MAERNHHLVEANKTLLEQGLELCRRLSASAYTARMAELGGSIGGHMRHVLEFYECFFRGLQGGCVDYDSRRRDEALEANPEAATQSMLGFLKKLDEEPLLYEYGILRVRMEDAPSQLGGDVFLASSVARELQVLLSHTTHHYALIAVALRLQGIAVPPQFGVASSTLRFWERKAVA
ncbi:MAG: DinB family protein [Acidobacteria bacterium]|nr:DinB family protein [Acidobacteriota bacterium]